VNIKNKIDFYTKKLAKKIKIYIYIYMCVCVYERENDILVNI